MNIGTTSIDSLPLSPQSDANIRLDMFEKGTNMNVANPSQNLQQERDNDPMVMQKNLNQFVTGLQQASAAGMTSLPSRDIPQNQDHIAQDAQIKPNYIPMPAYADQHDYIRDHQTNEAIIRAQEKKQEKGNLLDSIYADIQTPVLIGVLYFIFQLPVVRKQLFNFLPMLFNKDGNHNLSGFLFTSSAFALIYVLLTKGMLFLER